METYRSMSNAVQRQFESLRAQRVKLRRQPEGEEIDPAEFVAMMKSPGEAMLSSYTMTMTMKTGGEDVTLEGAVDVSINVGTNLASLRSTVATLVGKPIVVSTGDIAVSVTVSDGGG